MTEKARKSLKPVGCRPGVTYGLCKVHKANKRIAQHFEQFVGLEHFYLQTGEINSVNFITFDN